MAQNRPYAQAVYMPNGAPAVAPQPGAAPLLPNQGRIIQQGPVRVLCIADVRGNLKSLNDLAREAKANYIVHTGDFGFYDDRSLDRIAEKTLRHVAQYSPLLTDNVKRQIAAAPSQPSIKERFPRDALPLSELPLFLNKSMTLDVPVYTVWGACEDVQVLEKLRSGEYKVDNLHIIDEAHSRLLDVGGVKLRLLGLGGAVVMHKLFDNGEGRTTIAGGQGTMWTTLLQMGELVDTAARVYDPTETRIFVSHASPAREGLLNQLSVTLKADFSISAGLHFRYGSSYNEFSVNPTLDHYRGKLAASKASFDDVWQTVKAEVEPAVAENEAQQRLLNYALELVNKMPSVANGGNPFGGTPSVPGSGQIDESAFKNMWNFNLADAAYGWLVLDIEGGRIGTEMRAQGFNFSHRGGKAANPQQAVAPAGTPSSMVSTGAAPPAQPMTQRAPQGPPQQRPSGHPGPSPQAQQQQNRGPQPGAPRTGPSPHQAGPKDTPKSVTPQQNQSSANDKTLTKANGTAETEKSTDVPSKVDSPATDKPPMYKSQSLFVRNVRDEDEIRNLIADEDKSKIKSVEKANNFFVVHFHSNDEMQGALNRIGKEYRTRQPTGADQKPNFQIYRQPDSNSRWQPGAGNRGAGGPHGGYRSTGGGAGGGASDSETGRGGFRGRGRGRGNERGRGRGRGGFNGGERDRERMKGAEGAAGSPAPSAPATPAGEA